MDDLWPVLFSLAQVSFAVALIRNGSRSERLLTEVRALRAELAERRAPTPAICPKCGTRRVVLVNRPSDDFTRWACNCGAAGRWRSSMDPMSRTSVRATDRLDAVSAPAGSAKPDPLGSQQTGSGESQRGTQARDNPGS